MTSISPKPIAAPKRSTEVDSCELPFDAERFVDEITEDRVTEDRVTEDRVSRACGDWKPPMETGTSLCETRESNFSKLN